MMPPLQLGCGIPDKREMLFLDWGIPAMSDSVTQHWQVINRRRCAVYVYGEHTRRFHGEVGRAGDCDAGQPSRRRLHHRDVAVGDGPNEVVSVPGYVIHRNDGKMGGSAAVWRLLYGRTSHVSG